MSYGRPAPWPREVIVKLDSRTYPRAFAPDGREERNLLIAAAKKLHEDGCLRIVQHKRGPLTGEPKELRIGPDNLSSAYSAAEHLGFEPLSVALQNVERGATELAATVNVSWLRSYLEKLVEGIRDANLFLLGMQRDRFKRDWRDILLALRACMALAGGISPEWERVISERLFNDSKVLCRIRPHVVAVLVRADPRWDGVPIEEASDLLEAYGVRRKPGLIRCAGAGILNVGGRIYSLEDFVPVAHLPEAWADSWIDAMLQSEVRIITTVENEYPFFSYVEQLGGSVGAGKRGELVIYTAGFPTPSLVATLVRLAERAPNIQFRHWGDADVGGLRIWWLLRRRLQRPIDLFRTTGEWVASESVRGGNRLSGLERAALSRLRTEIKSVSGSDVVATCHLIDVLLKEGFKVEQERF